ncbi:hypothetical protein [Nostoc sp. CMAA1605]|uniref:hypothetical protein n=1 Tax=Nostoc sp. CMAA1605 TaxID=2055159 RepID=UPI001F374785|nr:hypothetical protein [Nostoc sp. CMAA1605]
MNAETLTTPQPKGVGILGLNHASTNDVDFGLTVSCLVRNISPDMPHLWTIPQA